MEDIAYLDFDLQVERAGQGYRVNVLASPAGRASGDFVLPFSDLELENFVLRMSRTRRTTRRVGTPELEAARTFGGRLYEAVFSGEVRGCLRSSMDEAARQGRGLRLRLRLGEAPELVDLPWEFLYSPALNRFFALSNTTPIVRYLDLPEPVAPLAVQPPLRLLTVIASPRDFPALDVAQEWAKLRDALKELEDSGRISLERLEPPTLAALQRRLRAGPCHILHFIGHGTFDEATQDGQLLLEDKDGRGHVISAQDLGVLLHDHPPMRLVVLNSCEGARTSRTDPFAGTAQSLVQQGMPAVLAMQFEISDDAAILTGHEFYSALAAGYPADAALAEARKAIFTSGTGAEWGTPVLYLRAPDGRLFGMSTPAPPPKPPPAAPEPAPRRVPARKLQWALAGVVVVLVLAFALSRVLPGLRGATLAGQVRAPGAGTTAGTAIAGERPPEATQPAGATRGAEASPAGQASPEKSTPGAPGQGANATSKTIEQLVAANPRVSSSTAWVHDLVPASDGVWAATSGGLVRWKADGTSKVFTSGDGLPFSHAQSLLGMPDGSLWVGGNSAVLHAQPVGETLGEIKRYSEAEGVLMGEQPRFLLDTDGSIWLATQYGQGPPVQRFDGKLWRAPDLPSVPEDDPALKDARPLITSMVRARDGSFWVGLDAAVILRFDGAKWSVFGPEQGLAEKQGVRHLLEDERGTLWATTGDGGLLRFEPDSGKWKRTEFQRADAPIYWISELPDKSLWASGDDFIAKSTDGGQNWTPAATPGDDLYFPTVVVQDGAGVIWAATGNGLAAYDGSQWRTLRRPGEPSTHRMGQIVPDPDGKLWVLPEYGGVPSVIDPATGEATAPSQWPPNLPDIISMAFGDGATWAGTSNGLLRVQDGSLRSLGQADGLPDNKVGALVATTRTLWIGTSQGLATLDLATGQVTGTVEALAGQAVDRLAVAPDGTVWAGTHWGVDGEHSAIYRIAGANPQSWPNDQLPLNGPHWVESLAVAEDGTAWVGSDGGLYRWDRQKWLGWADGQGAPPSGDLYAILSHDGAVWIAGHSRRIDRWDAKNGWRRIRPKGLTADVLDMFVTGDGSLWLATGDGLLRYGP